MSRQRSLNEPSSGKTWGVTCTGSLVVVRSGAPGKEKEVQKTHPDAMTASAWAEKEEWARLKKGWVLSNPQAGPGEPLMHLCLGRGYRGSLISANIDGQLLCNQGPPSESAEESDQLVIVDTRGAITDAVDLPADGKLASQVAHVPSLDIWLVLAGRVWQWSTHGRCFNELSSRFGDDFLTVSGTRAAWYDEPDLVVHDLSRHADVFRQRVEAQLYEGHTTQMAGALSPDGARLACCAHAGEMQLWDVASQTVISSWSGNFEMIQHMCFSSDGRWLFALERYGAWKLRCFDMTTLTERQDFPDLSGLNNSFFAIEPSGARIAIASRKQIEIIDIASGRSQRKFSVDHVVKRFNLTWLGAGSIGVRTDYGCASIYAVDPA